MLQYAQPKYNAMPLRTASLVRTPSHPHVGFRVTCGNGHSPIVRYFGWKDEANSDAIQHNLFVHDDAHGSGIATVDPVFVNIPF